MIAFDVKQLRTAFEALVAAFVIVMMMAPKFIPWLKKLKFGQEVRDDGPESHLKKQGTPTMGGIMILAGILAGSLLGFAAEKKIETVSLQILFLTFGLGLAGFLDDYLKIRRHNSKGLSPKAKLLIQLAAAVIFTVWIYYVPAEGIQAGEIVIPFTGYGPTAVQLSLPLWLYLPCSVFVILGTDNGVNFTDGLDGLCSSVTIVIALFFAAAILLITGCSCVTAASVAGALAAFLFFNANPAKVFMGDTGSLALGGFVAACASVTGAQLYLIIAGFLYMAEVVSVIIQVGYFKLTHGKRFFKMAPIHHHFELCGNSETRIVTAFTVITGLLAGLSAVGLFFTR